MRKKPKSLMGIFRVDNQPKTMTDKQVLADVFGNFQCYPNIATCTKALPVPDIKTETCKPEKGSRKRPILQQQIKNKRQKRTEKKQAKSVKHQVKAKPVKPPVKSKGQKRTKKKKAKSVKPKVYKPAFIVTPTKENPIMGDQSEFTFNEEQFSSDDDHSEYTFNEEQYNFNDEQLNSVVRNHGFGPRIVYE